MKDKIYIGEGIIEQIKKPLYYDDFTFNDVLEWFQRVDDAICEEYGFMKHDWKNT